MFKIKVKNGRTTDAASLIFLSIQLKLDNEHPTVGKIFPHIAFTHCNIKNIRLAEV